MTRDRLWAQLDSVRPNSADLAAPELADAAAELDRDPSLAREMERRQIWDRQIAIGLADVPVPDGLKERLLARLDQDSKITLSASRPLSRRRWLSIVGATAAGVAAAAIVSDRLLSNDPILTLAAMTDLAIDVLRSGSNLPAFTGDFAPQLPADFSSASLLIADRFYGLEEREGEFAVAATPFALRGATEKKGVLLVIPAADIVDPPQAESIFDRSYLPSRTAGVETAAWTEQPFVYVCAINGTVAELVRRLDRPAV